MLADTIRIYDPPLCCSTGVCGPQVDSELVRFAADLQWLEASGVSVERFNLAQQPAAFVENAAVMELLNVEGATSLPALVVGGEVVSRGRYPSRDELAAFIGLEAE